MREKAFHIANQDESIAIVGGQLHQAPEPAQSGTVFLQEKEIQFCLCPEDELAGTFQAVRKLIQGLSPWLSLRLFAITLLTPIVLILPAIILIVFIGTVGAYGNLINELISLDGREMTNLGITKYQLFFIQTSIYIAGAYAFPLFFQGDYDDTISRFKQLTDNKEIMKSRLRSAFKLLHQRGYVERIIMWNPNLISEENEWIPETVLPAIAQSQVPVRMMIKIEEQFICKKVIEEIYDTKFTWHEAEVSHHDSLTQSIPFAYLESWEKEMWQVFSRPLHIIYLIFGKQKHPNLMKAH